MIMNPYIWANKEGIVRLEASGVSVGSDSVTFTFNSHRFLNAPYSGLILFKLPSFTAPATAVPIIFSTSGKNQAVTYLGGTAITSAMLNEAGVYLAYYENGTLQMLTGINI